MAQALSASVELRLDQALAQYRQWRTDAPLETQPRVLGPLAGGASNHAFLVEARDSFVVRIDGIDPDLHGLNRHAEWRALQSAAAARLAPTPRYFNPELGALVVDYLAPDACNAFDSQSTAELLRGIHALPPLHSRLDLAARLRCYLHRLETRDTPLPDAMASPVSQLPDPLAELDTFARAPVACHNDLLPGNRLFSGGRWWALDWEYAAMGNRWFDVAVVVWGEQLDLDAADRLTFDYLHRAPQLQEQRQLSLLVAVYGVLECAWYLAAGHSVGDDTLQRLTSAFEAL